jgi:hypothetical protein
MFGGEAIQALDMVTAVGGLLCLSIVGAVIQAVYVALRSTAFTLAYQEWTGKGLVAETKAAI